MYPLCVCFKKKKKTTRFHQVFEGNNKKTWRFHHLDHETLMIKFQFRVQALLGCRGAIGGITVIRGMMIERPVCSEDFHLKITGEL